MFRILTVLTILFVGFSARAESFLSILDDVPLMPGLSEQADAGMVFDSPQGRLAETHASGPVTADAVAAFYDQTLPQLGWARQGPNLFLREGESLHLMTESTGAAVVTVRFALKPATNP
ncbi:hypothetical protein [Magnetospira sp. QH-2]|uniref:hypothetical protein n=1 Tax=Magnetospira sp. (strain QH-2) TaxID=1288970 RepID=UPI0003E80AEE|nr:hypothetical protein [Magnetospira sp. QH-2]CCQ75738.1 conserved protein of unknown function [Magnetospira sp. QH-2]